MNLRKPSLHRSSLSSRAPAVLRCSWLFIHETFSPYSCSVSKVMCEVWGGNSEQYEHTHYVTDGPCVFLLNVCCFELKIYCELHSKHILLTQSVWNGIFNVKEMSFWTVFMLLSVSIFTLVNGGAKLFWWKIVFIWFHADFKGALCSFYLHLKHFAFKEMNSHPDRPVSDVVWVFIIYYYSIYWHL